MARRLRGPWLLCLLLWSFASPAHAQQVDPTVVVSAGLRTLQHQGGFKAAQYLPDGTAVLLEDQGDGLHLLQVDAGLTKVLAEAQLGGNEDHGLALATDGLGNIFVGGTSSGGPLSGTGGVAFPARSDASLNSFVAKFDSGLHLLFLTFLGSGRTALTGLAATRDTVFATGVTYGANFPTTAGVVISEPVPGNLGDGFLEAFAADNGTLRYATYIGGPGGSTSPAAIAADSQTDAVYVAGSTAAPGYPAIDALQGSFDAPAAGFLSRLDSSGSRFLFSTFIAGDGLTSLSLDPASGDLLATGNVNPSEFPVADAVAPLAALPYQTLLRFSPDGQDLRDSVLLLSGSQSSIRAEPNGSIWVTGEFPAPLSPQELLAGEGDGYAVHLRSDDSLDTVLRLGGYPANNPDVAFLHTLPGPAAISNDGSSLLLPATLSAGTSAALASSTVFHLDLTAPTAALPSSVTEIVPQNCSAPQGCAGTAGLLLRLSAPTANAHVAVSVGDAPNITLRNLGPVTTSGLNITASNTSFVSDCPEAVEVGAQCGLVLGGDDATSISISGFNLPALSMAVPAAISPAPAPLLLSVPSLDFGLVTSAGSPALRTITVTNLGTTAEIFASLANNPPVDSSYSLQETSSTCTGPAAAHVLAAGASCSLTVGLSASTDSAKDGMVNAAWRLGDRSLPVTGYTQAHSLSLSSATIDFGSQPAGASALLRFLYLSNASPNPETHSPVTAPSGSPFQIDDNCPTVLEPQSVCQLAIRYVQPNAPSVDNLDLTLDDGLRVLVTGRTTVPRASSAPLVSPFSVNPAAITFQNASVASTISSEEQVVEITNNFATALPLNASVLGDFLLDNTCPAALAPQASCDLGIRFTPSQTGVRDGLLSLSAGSSFQSQQVTITGTATPLLNVGDRLDMGEAPIDEPLVRWFQLQGSTRQQLTASTVGTGFGIALLDDDGAGHGTLPATAFHQTVTAACLRCWVAIQFRGQTAGSFSGVLTASTDLSGRPLQTALAAIALPASGLILTPAQSSFGAVPVRSSSSPTTLTLTNQLMGSLATNIRDVIASPGFSVVNTGADIACSGTLASTASCAIQIAFTPAAEGPQTGTLTVVTDAGSTTAVLSGTGTPSGNLSLQPVELVFGPQVEKTVTLTNTGAQPLTIGPASTNDTSFVAVSHCTVLSPAQSCDIDVSDLAATSAASLSFETNAVTSDGETLAIPYAVPLHASEVAIPPRLELFPTQADFGVSVTGVPGSTRRFSLKNIYSTNLAISLLASHNFPLTGEPDCSSVTPGGVCTFSVTFLPETNGPLTGSLTVLATTPDGTQVDTKTLYLQGFGQGSGTLAISAGTIPAQPLSFGTVPIGSSAPQVLTLTNQGLSSLAVRRISTTYPFQATSTCVPILSPGAECQVNLVYAAASAGTAQIPSTDIGTVLIESDAQSGPDTVYLTAQRVSASSSPIMGDQALPVFSLDQSAVTFSNVVPGQASVPQQITVSNPGSVPVIFGSLQASTDFAATTDCARLDPGTTCHVAVVFQPSSATPDAIRIGTLEILSNSTTALDFVSLLGSAVAAPLQISADTLQFGAVAVGSHAELSLSLTNASLLPVALGPISMGGDFSVLQTTCPGKGGLLGAGENCAIVISFAPRSAGEQTAQLMLPTSAQQQPLQVGLSGTGEAGRLSVDPTAVRFGNIDLNQSTAATLTLSNSGTAPLTAIMAAITGSGSSSYTVASSCLGLSLAPGERCSLQVTFTPAVPGLQGASLTLSSSDPAGVTTIPLSGTGIQAPVATVPGFTLTVNGASSAAAQITSGQTAAFALVATPTGGFGQPLALSCTAITAAPNASCAMSSNLLAMAQGPAQAQVTLSTLRGVSTAATLPWAGGLLLGTGSLLRRRRKRSRSPVFPWLLALTGSYIVLGALTGCGDGPNGYRLPYTPAGVYTYRVSATPASGDVPPNSVTLVLTVK